VLTACNGVDAIEVYSQHQHRIQLVLIDLMMPLMDGPSTIRTLRRINPNVEVVAMSGLSSKGMIADAESAGVQRFLAKPFMVKDLLTTLKEALVGKMGVVE